MHIFYSIRIRYVVCHTELQTLNRYLHVHRVLLYPMRQHGYYIERNGCLTIPSTIAHRI